MKYGMTQVDMPKSAPEPIGHELSVNIGKFKGLKAYKVGDKVSIEAECVIVGQRMHNIGKNKEHMMDLKITDFECSEEKEDGEDGDNAE